ncbi:MAG: hypothetical protein ACX930_09635 [Erythrobacter sp.]
MSRQLTISSLSSALALVALALIARAGAYTDIHADMQAGRSDMIVQVQDVSALSR